jgi:hypothetical protein
MKYLHTTTNQGIALLALLAALAGCASAPAGSQVGSQVGQAATTPLSDLNLVRAEIPAVLAEAQRSPYAVPADGTCSAIASHVQALDAALGADLDTPVTSANPSLIDRGGDAVGGALRNAAEGVVPFRGWVRKLSGAERYARDVAAAIAAGTVRRAFLKGLGQASRCAPPAAPLRP